MRLLLSRAENGLMAKRRAALAPRMLVVKEVAEHCHNSERTVWRWIRDGKLKVHRLVRCIRISEKDFAKFLRRNRK